MIKADAARVMKRIGNAPVRRVFFVDLPCRKRAFALHKRHGWAITMSQVKTNIQDMVGVYDCDAARKQGKLFEIYPHLR